MFRYIALVWNVSDGRQSRTAEALDGRLRARRWQQVFAGDGLRVFCVGVESGALTAHPLANDAGVIVGAIFERHRDVNDDSASRKAAVGGSVSEAILASKGQWLIDNCWGNYVAFLRDPRANGIRVLKDPAGNLPCFKTHSDRVTVVFSHVGDCLDIDVRQFTINRPYLQSRVVGFNDLEQNALNEVEQILRGECVEIDPGAEPVVRSRRFYWNPFSFQDAQRAIEDPERAAASMRATVRSCTQTWAACYGSLLHRLSGGLDSSIVAGCLGHASSTPRIACYTYYNPQGRSDERPWARLAAEHTGFEHFECPIIPADIRFADLVRSRPAIEPMPLLGYLLSSTVEHRLAAERHASAIFTGDGGDSGFCSDSLPYAVTDYLRRHGIRPQAFRLASEVALRTERSSWAVLLRSIRQWLFGARMTDQLPALLMGSRLVSAQLRGSFSIPQSYPHPWFSDVQRVPWDTIRRLGVLVCTPEFYNVAEPSQPAPEIVSPLYAQPAVELFLRIPIYRHAEGGRDRGLARRAFEREVPEPILRRLWKDRAPGFHSELLYRNLDLVRELFLDGILVREGLLDRAAVENALSSAPARSDVLPVEIYRHLDVEIWARQWM